MTTLPSSEGTAPGAPSPLLTPLTVPLPGKTGVRFQNGPIAQGADPEALLNVPHSTDPGLIPDGPLSSPRHVVRLGLVVVLALLAGAAFVVLSTDRHVDPQALEHLARTFSADRTGR